VAGRCEQAADEQRLLGRTDVPVGLQQRDERVAHRLEDGESGADRDADDDPAADRRPVPGPEEHHQDGGHDQLGRLLDQPDPGHRQRPEPAHRVVLEQARDHHADDSAEQQASAQRRPVDQPAPGPPGRERHERQRYDERPEQDHGREEIRVLGVGQDVEDEQVQPSADHERAHPSPPARHLLSPHVQMVPGLALLRHVAETAVMDRPDPRDRIANSFEEEVRLPTSL
jgi:hypothetical protein